MLEPLIYIIVGFALASLVWFFYFKTKNSNLIDRSLLDEKESLINERDLSNKELEGKIAAFQKEVELLNNAKDEISICSISGPVGTYNSIDPRVEEYVAKKLGLSKDDCILDIGANIGQKTDIFIGIDILFNLPLLLNCFYNSLTP